MDGDRKMTMDKIFCLEPNLVHSLVLVPVPVPVRVLVLVHVRVLVRVRVRDRVRVRVRVRVHGDYEIILREETKRGD